MLKFLLLGEPIVQIDDQPLPNLIESPVCLRLLAFLVMHRQQPMRRDQLAAQFWPDLSDKRARQTLSNVIWRLRNSLRDASAALLVTNITLQFNLQATFWLDVDVFDQAISQLIQQPVAENQIWIASAEQTLALYRGNFLQGFADEWCIAKREQLRRGWGRLTAKLIAAYHTSGNLERALYFAHQALLHEPDSEQHVRTLMELQIATDSPVQAQQTLRRYEQLCREVNLIPSVQLLEFAKQHGLKPFSQNRRKSRAVDKKQELARPPLSAFANPEYLRRELEIRRKNDELLDLMAERQQQFENLLYMQELADRLNDPLAKIDLLARQAWLATRQGDYQAAIAFAQDGLAIGKSTGLDRQQGLLHRLLGVASEEMGNFKSALHHYTQAFQLDEPAATPTVSAINLNNLAATYNAIGNYPQALRYLEQAWQAIAQQPASSLHARIAGNQGFAWLKLGALEKAENHLQQASQFVAASGEHDVEWWLALGFIQLRQRQQQIDRAIDLAQQHYRRIQTTGDAWALTALADLLAQLYLQANDGKTAQFWAQQALDFAQSHQQWRYQLRSRIWLAWALLLSQQFQAAFACVQNAINQCEQKNQTMEDEPILYAVYAACAHATNQPTIAANAEKKHDCALYRQADLIEDLELRQNFLNLANSVVCV